MSAVESEYPRELSPTEKHFLDVLLSRPFVGRDELREQAPHVTVTGLSCTCGCPSLALSVDASAPPAPVRGMVTEGNGLDANGNYVGVTLFVDDDGYMNDFDVWAWGDDIHGRETISWGWPTVESFELPEWEPHPDGLGATLKNPPGRAKHHAE